MGLEEKQQQQSKARFLTDMESVDPSRLSQAASAGERKLNQLSGQPPSSLAQLWQDLRLMVNLLNDYRKGHYRTVPWKVIAAITAALVYFVSPVDVVPDFLPLAGYLDDALVIKLALDLARADLARYSQWRTWQSEPDTAEKNTPST
ncbi:hypothetical protein GCM10011502_19270 [Oceanisphaera marina]|uniref:DUF1232 domain-containing protein n=2 Tax=Oceanisphaera marina TaxID=2017550 RepID=A0ABQ1IMH3_9GAMM|nr:hypothetical protein GCM10011502_19270 [Oceanisphaera marina]